MESIYLGLPGNVEELGSDLGRLANCNYYSALPVGIQSTPGHGVLQCSYQWKWYGASYERTGFLFPYMIASL